MSKFDKLLDEPNWKDRAAELQAQVDRVVDLAKDWQKEKHAPVGGPPYGHHFSKQLLAAINGEGDEQQR